MGCCRQTEASVSDRHLEGLIAKSAAEVVNLVDDEEIEAISELVHVPVRALERGNRQGRPPAHAVAITPDWAPVQGPDFPKPLIEQDSSRDETQRAQPRPVHGSEGQPGLAAPGWESDDAVTAPQFPGGPRRLLIGSEIELRPRSLGRPQGRRDVLESGAALEQPALQGCILAGGRSMGMDAKVPEDARRLAEVQILRRILQHDGPAVES